MYPGHDIKLPTIGTMSFKFPWQLRKMADDFVYELQLEAALLDAGWETALSTKPLTIAIQNDQQVELYPPGYLAAHPVITEGKLIVLDE